MLPDCYTDKNAVIPFFEKAKECLPLLAYANIHGSYADEEMMFKVVALTHLRNFYKKAAIAEKDLKELITLLDTFRDPYQVFYETGGFRTWEDTKKNIIGGIIS